MPDSVTVDNGVLTDYVVSSDEGAGGHVQRVKLAYSADGSETHVSADASGLLVNLGANNDVITTAVADTGNSTTATLAGGAVFTGAAFDLNNYASWSVSIFSNVASATNGISVQWSEDTTNWDFADAATYVAAVGNMVTFGRKARYVRLVYTNGAGAQATFRVYAWAQPISVQQTRKFIGSALTDQDTGQVVVAALQGHTTAGGGAWVDVKVTPSGAVSTETTLAAGTANIGDVDVLSIAAGDNNIGNVDVVTLPALPAGTNNIGDVDVLSIAAGDNNIGNVDIVTVPAPLSTTGTGTEATALRVTVATDSTGVLSVDDNGGSLTVDGTVTATEKRGATSAITTVADNAASVTILASNANRLEAIVTNDSSARLYLLYGAGTASLTNYTLSLAQHESAIVNSFTAALVGIWASDPGDGAARVTEVTA